MIMRISSGRNERPVKCLLATTALVSAITALPAYAQTATDTTTVPTDAPTPAAVTLPEGYGAYDTMALAGHEVRGATVHGVNGEPIGAVSDCIFDMRRRRHGQRRDRHRHGHQATTCGENLEEHPTHVVLDIGGFLGIGARTVALTTSDLQVFRDENNDLRIYLPGTREQLEALPECEEGNPATHGATTGAATN
jgi:hypothetical protein